jgi:hypothetical protein
MTITIFNNHYKEQRLNNISVKRMIVTQSRVEPASGFNIMKTLVTELGEKTTYKERLVGSVRNDLSIEDSLNAHFAVLTDIKEKFEDYTAIPIIPVDHWLEHD